MRVVERSLSRGQTFVCDLSYATGSISSYSMGPVRVATILLVAQLGIGSLCLADGAPTTAPTTQPADVRPSGVYSPGDAAILRSIAQANDKNSAAEQIYVTVEGTVSNFRPAASGRVIRFYFKEADDAGRDGFYCAFFPADGLFDKMRERFGGRNGSGMLGRRVRVIGVPKIYLGRPQAIINDIEQITLIR